MDAKQVAAIVDQSIEILDRLELLEPLVGLLRTKAGAGRLAFGAGAAGAGDAIDAELGRPPRTTSVPNLRESPEMEHFRTALIDGLIVNDAGRQLLQLVNTVLTQLI